MNDANYNVTDSTKKMKLLFIEDDELSRELMQMMLSEFFDDIITASDGLDGLEKYLENDIDLILTDINMPRMSGLAMIEKIRDENKQVPILILSAYNDTDYLMNAIKYNINGYINKPIQFEQIEQELRKITDRYRLEEKIKESNYLLEQYQEVVDSSAIVSKTDLKGIITYVNNNFCFISGYSKKELIGKSHNIVRHPDMTKETYAQMWDTIKNKKKIWRGIVKNRTKSGKSYYVKSVIKPILNREGNIVEYIALRGDITDIMNPKKQLQDLLKSVDKPLLVYFKLDEFNIIQELFDSKTIEELEDKLLLIMIKNLEPQCYIEKIFQLGNGEFAIVSLLSECLDDIEFFKEKVRTFQKVIQNETIDLGNFTYDVALDVSISYVKEYIYENALLGIEKMHHNKEKFIIANNLHKDGEEQVQKNMETLSMIRTAIHNGNIISYFQPIIDNKTQTVSKYESLVRLVSEDGKVLAPFFFLDTAKKGKYYTQITQIVLQNSFKALLLTDKDISINLSAIDIELEVVRDEIFTLLEKNKQDANRVIFELLEDESIQELETIKIFIKDVKVYGVKIAIDDFGAGYSNFERLLEYQPDILKIDGSLIKNIETDSYALSIVKTIVRFAKEQKLQIVAEFVENKAIYTILNGLDIDFSQGYYFARPEPLLKDCNV